MRDPRNAFRPFTIQTTKDAREKLAATHFELEAVREAISTAAARGEGAMRLPLGQLTAELRDTEAARKLAVWCADNGLALEWTETVLQRPNGLKLRTVEPVITWIEETRSH